MLTPGTRAPLFTLPNTPGSTVGLASLAGHPVVLVFYPADWSPVCGDQLALYNELGDEFAKLDATLVAISVDSAWCHAAYKEQRRISFALLADFEPKGRVAKLYGAYNEDDGTAKRALFVLDAAGVIRWSYLSPDSVNPGADGILSALEALSA